MTGRPINAAEVERLWGRSALAKGSGALGLSAALWQSGLPGPREISRPACDHTHVISIWIHGSAHSELSIDGKPRFRRNRARGSFQCARAGESVRAVLSQTTGNCLDLYLPKRIVDDCLEQECEAVRSGFEIRPLQLERDPVVTRIGDQIAGEIQTPGMASQVALDGATLMLAVNLIRRWSNQADEVRLPQAGLAPWQTRRVVDYLQAHLADDVSLADLAAVAKLSPFHFARAFKASVGKPPHAYQCALRVERAQRLLIETDLPITEVAAQVGCESPQTLSRMFQREIGITPRRYRQSKRS